MISNPRISFEMSRISAAVKGLIASPDVAAAGKLQPAKMPKGKRPKMAEESSDEEKKSAPEAPQVTKSAPLFAKIVKAEKRLVTGLVLRPEVTDGQGDIMSAEVIAKAAYDWLARFGKKTQLGLQHSSFKKNEDRFVLAESYIAPINFALGSDLVTEGTWLMTVKVLDDDIWEAVKAGEITGFSIGGRATAEELTED
jgi:hypothetical protein